VSDAAKAKNLFVEQGTPPFLALILAQKPKTTDVSRVNHGTAIPAE
jgi:hypothetical protein